MILLIKTTSLEILDEEYVRPLIEIVKGYDNVKVVSYRRARYIDYSKFDRILISGTALKDFDYLNYVEDFSFLKKFKGKAVGICAGAQIISMVFGANLVEKRIIGVKEVKVEDSIVKAYFLITRIPILNESFEIIGKYNDIPAIFKVKNRDIFGFLFHPEVLNKVLLLKYLGLKNGGP